MDVGDQNDRNRHRHPKVVTTHISSPKSVINIDVTIILYESYFNLVTFCLQACILKELEDKWGDTYLSTFPDTGSAAASKQNVHSETFFNEAGF